MKIRRFKLKDVKALVELSKKASKELGWGKESIKDFKRLFKRNKNLIWIAEDKNKMIGFLYGDLILRKGILKRKKVLELASIYIIKEYRNKGIATKLTKEFLNVWKKSNYKGVICFATNKIALSLAKDVGFKQKVYYLEKKFEVG